MKLWPFMLVCLSVKIACGVLLTTPLVVSSFYIMLNSVDVLREDKLDFKGRLNKFTFFPRKREGGGGCWPSVRKRWGKVCVFYNTVQKAASFLLDLSKPMGSAVCKHVCKKYVFFYAVPSLEENITVLSSMYMKLGFIIKVYNTSWVILQLFIWYFLTHINFNIFNHLAYSLYFI